MISDLVTQCEKNVMMLDIGRKRNLSPQFPSREDVDMTQTLHFFGVHLQGLTEHKGSLSAQIFEMAVQF